MTKNGVIAEATEILYIALGEPIGLLIKTNDLNGARARFYAARKLAQDPALAVLQMRASPVEGGELVIIKGPGPGAEELGL
jgi:hypothetical protein